MSQVHRIIVAGLPGSRHDEVGRELAQLVGGAVVSTDELLEQHFDSALGLAFVEHGEETMRAAELQMLRTALERAADLGGERVAVIVVGSGIVETDAGRQALVGEQIAFCDVNLPVAAKRLGFGLAATALVNPRATLLRQAGARRPQYEAIAACTVLTDEGEPGDHAAKITAALGLSGG